MKIIKWPFAIFCLLSISLSNQSCIKDKCAETRQLYVWNPVYKDVDAIRKEFSIDAPKPLTNPGKIYYYNNHILISEPSEGIHIINNDDPSTPLPISFIKIPGVKDMAVRNGRLYADNYIDLLTIDISDISNPELVSRTPEVFNDYSLHQDYGYLIKYEQSLETVEVDCNDDSFYYGWGGCANCEILTNGVVLADANFSNAPASSAFNASVPSSATTGIGGSFARFTIAKNNLYTVDEIGLKVFDLVDSDTPNYIGNVNIGWGIETIFPLGDNLFIGSNSGMFIFDITEPNTPSQLSNFEHARACDPVFVSDDKAYVTLRDGNTCAGYVNQLDIVDVSDLLNPSLIASHIMDNPHGLSVRGSDLFICEGIFGLKVFDRSSDMAINENLLAHISEIHAYDIITLSTNLALVIGADGLFQYDISDTQAMHLLSTINVNREQ